MTRIGNIISYCGVVVLAAGVSSRLQRPKQLLQYEGKSLLQHAVETANGSVAKNVVVVTGANAEIIETELQGKDCRIIYNEEWEEGMASSIRKGIEETKRLFPETDGILIMACDQPYVTVSLLNELIQVQNESGKPVAASAYGGTLGIPVLFHKNMFAHLLKLTGDTGAKKLITDFRDDVAIVPFEKGITDIDTMKDYEELLNSK